MAINKVIDRNNNTLIDLTHDTVEPNKVLSGVTFHKADGTVATGMLEKSDIDMLKYKFFDYDGTLLYSYTDEELDALTELPQGPNHTDENLTFQKWNWSLEDLKAWNRERLDRPSVGANYITTDGKSYLYLDTPLTGASLKFSVPNNTYLKSVDWGDGTIDTSFSSSTIEHVYANPGEYIIIIDIIDDAYWYFGNYSTNTSSNKQYIKYIKLGKMKFFDTNGFRNCSGLETISVPTNLTHIGNMSFNNCYSLKSIVIPEGIESIGNSLFYYCYGLGNICIPKTVTSISDQSFNYCYSLNNITFPDNLISIGEYAFGYCYSLTRLYIPDSVTSIGNSAFAYCSNLKNVSNLGNALSIPNSTFNYCYNLRNVLIPDSVTSIGTYAFQYCYQLREIVIPDSVTSIGSSAFNSDYIVELDLSKQTKVITLTGSLGLPNHTPKILVPLELLANYKSASYWSNYAQYMVGV